MNKNIPLFFPCVLFALAISGCALPKKQPTESPVNTPGQWPAAGNNNKGSVQNDWITTFNDKKLVEITQEAVSQNFDLKAVAARMEAAKANARIAGADIYPHANAGLQGGRNDQPWVDLNPIDSGALSLNLSWEIDVWGRIRATKKAAAAESIASQLDYAGARLSLAGLAAKSWFVLVESELQVKIAQDDVVSIKQTYDLTEERFKFGATSQFDVKLIGATLKASEINLVQRKENLEKAKRDLEVVLARFPGGTISSYQELPPLIAKVPAGLPSELLMRRPDLRAAEWRYFASENRVFSAKAERLPRISLTSSIGTSSENLKSIFDNETTFWNIIGNLTQPIFEGGRIAGQIQFNQAQQKLAAMEYAQLVLNAFKEVEIVLVKENTLAEREVLQSEAYQLLKQAYSIAEEQYKAGQTDIIALQEAQRNMLNSRSSLLTIKRLRLENRVDLFLALGGDFTTPPEPFPVPVNKQKKKKP